MRRLAYRIYPWLVRHLGVCIAIVIFSVQAVALPQAGMSWDEPASFFIGRANLKFWMTGSRTYIEDIKNPELFSDSPFQYIYGEDIYPPFPFLIASATSYIFAETLHLMDVFTAHHLGELIIGVFGVWALYGLAIEAGLTVAIAGGVTLSYALYPIIFEYMRADPKDVPLVSMLTVAAYFCLRTINAWRKKQVRRTWVSGILFSLAFGLAECTKPTAILLVPIVLVWLIIAALRSIEFRKSLRPIIPFGIFSFVFLSLAVLVFFLAWPWLWADPIGRIGIVWSFFKTVGYNMPTPLFGTIYNAAVNLPIEYPFIILLIQFPVELTLLVVAGIVWAIYQFIRKSRVVPMLFVVWFTLSMGRFLVPGMIIYSRVRHFIDVVPAYFILAGFGAYGIYIWIKTHIHHFQPRIARIVLAGIFGVVIVHELVIIGSLYPYEGQYFNFLTGGIKRISDNKLFDVGSTTEVKEAVEFINKDSAGAPVFIYPCLMGHIARFYTAPNVRLTQATEYAQYTIVPNSVSWFEGALRFGQNNHIPAYVVKRSGAELFYVYKYKVAVGWRCGWETKSNYMYD